MMFFLVRLLRLLLIVLALRYVWKAVKASFAPRPAPPKMPPRGSQHPVLGNAEDIDYEDIA